MTLNTQLAHGAAPIVAIRRGVRPSEVLDIGRALVDAGIRIIEVPLNSPQPLLSIETLATHLGQNALVGLYRAGASVAAVRESAATFVTAWRASEAQRIAPAR